MQACENSFNYHKSYRSSSSPEQRTVGSRKEYKKMVSRFQSPE